MQLSSRASARFILEALESRTLFTVGAAYTPPTSQQIILNENAAWKFQLNPSGSPQSTTYNDSSWGTVTLPHTWDGSAVNPPTGDGWYRKTITVPSYMTGDEIYLQFLAADIKATVYVDGVKVGGHKGGWEAFDIDVTGSMTAGTHVVAIDVNNVTDYDVIPAGGGDFVKEGGLYRSVSLFAIPKTHVAITEPVASPDKSGSLIAGSGVYFSNSNVVMGAVSAGISVKTVLDNLSASAISVSVTSYLVGAEGIIRAQQNSTQSLGAMQTDVAVLQSGTVANPHLWCGRSDPYLYDLYVDVRNSVTGQLLDLNHQQVGIRSFQATANNGFFLNGQSYPLFGVNMHQDSGVASPNGGPAGWSQTDAQQFQDVDQALALGATILRTAHYQRDAAFYSYCDQKGLIVEAEFGLNGQVTSSTNGAPFVNSAEDMLTELILQDYNHPSIVFWSMFNEISSTPSNGNLITALNVMAHSLDTTGRYTISETSAGTSTDTINAVSDVSNPHYYNGWYTQTPSNDISQLDAWHNANPTQPVGVGEFGAGASAYQYQINPPVTIPTTSAVYHPRNGQTQSDEEQWAAISSRPYLLDAMVWTMFDFTTPSKNEGDFQGTNDKGLMTRDRTQKKDIYYFFQANWNLPGSSRGFATTPVLWISDHTWTDREGPQTVTVTAFSNIGAPTLTLNGGGTVTMTQQVLDGLTIPDAYTAVITLAAGANLVQIAQNFGGAAYTNAVTWYYHAAALAGTAFAHVDFTDTAANVQGGYVADTGQAYGSQGASGTYGWVDGSGNALANTAGTYNRTGNTSGVYSNLSARTGIVVVPGGSWQYQLPNGIYDIHIAAADSATANLVDNLTVNNMQLQATTFTTSGGTYEDFYATVNVTNGLLTVSAGPGMVAGVNGVPSVQGRIASIDISAIDNVPPSVSAVTVNNGDAQRSMIQSLSVTFSRPVTLQAGAVSLGLRNGSGGYSTVYALTAASGDGMTYQFSLASGAALTTLGDGTYDLVIDPTKVLAGNGAAMQSASVTTFTRLFGDSNGDGYVDNVDLFQFRTAYLGDPSAYTAIFDYDGDGVIGSMDLAAFRLRLGTHLGP